ncbi:mitochondrial processing peptidase beta subunit [Auriculariales sp. MPI-PUGE-AT-0066]|nr:mitochondrial processing peptidase beta subunit [Auriculariales sp. MPI-PUGE-AT-0066]
MASRFLASSALRALRTPRARGLARLPLRSYATVTDTISAPITELSTLGNGLTVATESHPSAQTATVGVWIDAGSRAETDPTNGTAHFLEHMAFKGTKRRSQHALELEVENLGAHLNAYTSREQTVYYAKAFRQDVPQAVDIVSDILQNSKLEEAAIERERDVILREQQEVDKQLDEVVFDHLHSVAFQHQPLGRTILGPKENILSIKQPELSNYIKTNYTADRMVLVGTGAVDHGELVKLAEQHFGKLPISANPTPLGRVSGASSKFVGSEVRVRDDNMDTAHIAIAVEDYFPMLVMQSIIGNWDRSLGASSLLSSRLSTLVHSRSLANSFMSFSTSYSDTGLWGIYLVTENFMNIDDLVHFTLREWTRMSIGPLDIEVERAKSQLKASLLLSLDGTTAIAEDIGRQLIERAVDAVTTDEIKRVAQKYLWDKDIAIAAVGRIEGLLDYSRIRADMSSMLY